MKNGFSFSCVILLVLFANALYANTDIQVQLDAATGTYTVSSSSLHWRFRGSTGKKLSGVMHKQGKDLVGDYQAITFNWVSNNEYTGTIRWYHDQPVVFFDISTPKGSHGTSLEKFPDFTSFPENCYPFSFHNRIFPLAQYVLEETSTPWLFFNDKKEAYILSPASDFIVSIMTGDGKTHISSGLNKEVQQLPAGFTHSSILVMEKGIRNTWDAWGSALRARYQRKIAANDADVMLNYFGFWTDVGGDYYYSYDTTKGYDGTLLAIKSHYEKEGIPLGYIQLDSWWYQKSRNNVYNKFGSDVKNPLMARGLWNRSGGLWEYKADPVIFPEGLGGFQKKLGLPLITHNRWIDSASPYHSKYKISGISATDPGYWQEIMGYLKKNGVVGYEQDWMNYAYTLNPEMISDIKVGNAFTDGMAEAAKEQDIDLQYCMALPRYFMQGVKYNNLTTIRVSGDRFKPERWVYFLFTSQLAYEMGIRPWSDVFKSGEMGNLIISVLSSGPVGTGDSLGLENKANIRKAARRDGVLVKPDIPLLPMDQTYLDKYKGASVPVLAYTYTQHQQLRTAYVFAFAEDSVHQKQFSFQPAETGVRGKVVVYEPLQNKAVIMDAADSFQGYLPEEKYTYFMIAPVTHSGIAFLGDAGKIAATGKKRIASITSSDSVIKILVSFVKGEQTVKLKGYAEKQPIANTGNMQYDSETHLFTLDLSLPDNGQQLAVSIHTQ